MQLVLLTQLQRIITMKLRLQIVNESQQFADNCRTILRLHLYHLLDLDTGVCFDLSGDAFLGAHVLCGWTQCRVWDENMPFRKQNCEREKTQTLASNSLNCRSRSWRYFSTSSCACSLACLRRFCFSETPHRNTCNQWSLFIYLTVLSISLHLHMQPHTKKHSSLIIVMIFFVHPFSSSNTHTHTHNENKNHFMYMCVYVWPWRLNRLLALVACARTMLPPNTPTHTHTHFCGPPPLCPRHAFQRPAAAGFPGFGWPCFRRSDRSDFLN